jgi:TRAP-type C4-dicarboxylate transport system permease small subunit
MKIIAITLILFFLAGTCYFSMNWFTFFRHQPRPSVEDRFLALTILFVATIFWVVLIPFYCFKVLIKLVFHQRETPSQPATEETEPAINYSQLLAK